ncbi:S1C family serine protease [Melioribacter sp. OK-6-Me]|uniref:S1C family serine protease n=1 Tax=unclassified Melioribacter TaxID=2627329 RepID=UPI003EDA1EDC
MKNLKLALLSSAITTSILILFYAFVVAKPGSNDLDKILESSNLNSKFANSIQVNDSISNSRNTIITETVKRVSSAVVGINVTEIRQYRDIFSIDPFFRQFFGDRFYNQQVRSLGSGTIISPDGYILTNDHVAGNAVEAIVTLTDGSQYEAEIVGTDPVSDICLLKIDATNLPYIEFGNSDSILIGEWVIALGNPFGLFDINDQPTVTVGVISAKGMNLGAANNRYYVDMLQTDAAINSGNSGGPLVNAFGQLIGMNTLIYTAQGSSGNVGVGFAIPSNKIKKVIKELKENGKIDREFWTGLSIQTIDPSIAKAYDLKSSHGVIITNVIKNSPADKAGFKVYDIILGINNFKVNNENTLIGILQEFRPGDVIDVKIMRDNKILIKKMKLERK